LGLFPFFFSPRLLPILKVVSFRFPLSQRPLALLLVASWKYGFCCFFFFPVRSRSTPFYRLHTPIRLDRLLFPVRRKNQPRDADGNVLFIFSYYFLDPRMHSFLRGLPSLIRNSSSGSFSTSWTLTATASPRVWSLTPHCVHSHF